MKNQPVLNIITYFVQIFCLPKEATVEKMVNACLLLIRDSQRHFTHIRVGFNLACMLQSVNKLSYYP